MTGQTRPIPQPNNAKSNVRFVGLRENATDVRHHGIMTKGPASAKPRLDGERKRANPVAQIPSTDENATIQRRW